MMTADKLGQYRQSIDNIDAALIYMLAERFKVTQAVGQMDQVTQQNAALVEQAAAAAQSLEFQAKNLVEVVSVFQLANEGA